LKCIFIGQSGGVFQGQIAGVPLPSFASNRRDRYHA
jgi:hypothetical protein